MALDFPSNPVNGQTYDNFIYDAAKGTWKSLSSGASPNYLVNPTITNAVISATAPDSATVPMTVKGAASQSANLQEWKDSSEVIKANINNTGRVSASQFMSDIGPNGIELKPGSQDHAYISYYPRTATPSTRGAYLGFPTSGSTNFTLGNEVANGLITFTGTPVTMPNQPVISGQIGSLGQQNSASLVNFDEFWVQRGITWNASTRRFTVPVAGLYRITMNPFFATGIGGGRIYIGINTDTPGGTTHRGHCYREAATYDTASLNSVVSLSANDYICFYLAGGSLYGNSADRFTQFTIAKIA